MGQIAGGVIVMVLFIAFAMWKGRRSGRITDADRRMREDEYWARKEEEGEDSGSVFSFSFGSSGNHDGDDGGGDGSDD
ncbi:MAG: hypothetical protein MI702_03450 [Chlorobiales bacterium]|nr:hypothetical protein [Chlorobiales bacterium]